MEEIEHNFVYGPCFSDHKSGKVLKRDNPDYFAPPLRGPVQRTLARMGLPMPERITLVHRGTTHDLLFLNSHGIVLRIGKTNYLDLINPGILQPLFWQTVTDENNHPLSGQISIGVYPGIALVPLLTAHEMINDREKQQDFAKMPSYKILEHITLECKNGFEDSIAINMGAVPRADDIKDFVMLVLDMDNNFNSNFFADRKQAFTEAMTQAKSNSKTDMMLAFMKYAIAQMPQKELEKKLSDLGLSDRDILADYIAAFEYHAPLRRAFWAAFNNSPTGEPNPRKLRLAWEMAHNYATKGYTIYKRPAGEQHRRLVQTRRLYTPWADAKS